MLPRPGSLSVRAVGENEHELVHPRCVAERMPDLEEGLAIWRAGEPEEAREVLLYALEGCGDNLWIHVALGRIALEASKDRTLARGHFGYAVELARRALPAGFAGWLPADRPANRPLHEAIDGLLSCLDPASQAADMAELRRLSEAWNRAPA